MLLRILRFKLNIYFLIHMANVENFVSYSIYLSRIYWRNSKCISTTSLWYLNSSKLPHHIFSKDEWTCMGLFLETMQVVYWWRDNISRPLINESFSNHSSILSYGFVPIFFYFCIYCIAVIFVSMGTIALYGCITITAGHQSSKNTNASLISAYAHHHRCRAAAPVLGSSMWLFGPCLAVAWAEPQRQRRSRAPSVALWRSCVVVRYVLGTLASFLFHINSGLAKSVNNQKTDL